MRFSKALIAVAAGCQFAAASPVPQDDGNSGTDVCSLSSRDPASWAASGGEDQVNKFINDNGADHWLLELDKTQENKGGSAAISCGSIGATGCATPQAACSSYNTKSYFFVMTMVARVNEVFSVAHRKLTSATIKDVLAIGKIINDFKIPGDPSSGDVNVFRTTAAALSMADKVAKNFLGPLGDILGFIGGIFGIMAANHEVKVTDYAKLEIDMEQWLSDVFASSEDAMERALATIMGEGKEGDKILDNLLEQMNKMGRTGFGSDYASPISKVLAGGKFMPPATESDINTAFDEGFKAMRHGMIGNYLAGLQSFVQKDDTTKQDDCQASKGKYWDGSACHSLLNKGVTGDIGLFSEDTIKKFGDYDLNFETFMINVIDCNNGEVDPNNFNLGDRQYPKCYFGLAFADYVDGDVNRKCYTNFRNWKDLPSWLFSRDGTFTKDCKEFNLPFQGNCLVNSAPDKDWYESALRRYRTRFSSEGDVDLGGICNYFTHSHCTGYSNVQCWEADEGGYIADLSFVQGPLGQQQNDDCIESARNQFQRDNDCRTG